MEQVDQGYDRAALSLGTQKDLILGSFRVRLNLIIVEDGFLRTVVSSGKLYFFTSFPTSDHNRKLNLLKNILFFKSDLF